MNSPFDQKVPKALAMAAEQQAALRERVRPAPGALLSYHSDGVSFRVKPVRGNFSHPFTCRLSGAMASFSRGIVLGGGEVGAAGYLEATIGGVPVEGTEKKPAPTLKLDPSLADKDGQSWLCLDVTAIDEKTGLFTKESRAEIGHYASPNLASATVGRWALVLLAWNGEAPRIALPIANFNPRHVRTNPAAGAGVPQHFFL